MDERTPLTAGELDHWSGDLPRELAAAAHVYFGIGAHGLARAIERGPEDTRFVPWGFRRFESPPPRRASEAALRALAEHRPAEDPVTADPPPLRLAVSGDIVPSDVVPLLLACPGVSSAVVPAQRAAGSLRRRDWQWPFRIGVLDPGLARALEQTDDRWQVPSGLVQVSDVRTDPGAVGVLVARGSPQEVSAQLRRHPVVANAVLCAGRPGDAWPVDEAQLALLRAQTGAVVSGIVEDEDLRDRLLTMLRHLSHGHAFDVAATSAFERNLVLVGELDALEESSLPAVVRARTEEFRLDLVRPDEGLTMAEPPLAVLDELVGGRFDSETGEASGVLPHLEELDHLVEEQREGRLLQAYVGPLAESWTAPPDNVLRRGGNTVAVFVGPAEAAALSAGEISDEALGFTAGATSVRLTVILSPLDPVGAPVRAELDVPRLGRSADVRLRLAVPGDTTTVHARLTVLHRNRVIQTALLTGDVDGAPARLHERVVLWDDFGHLDDRRAFDRSFVLNHTSGTPAIATFAHGTGVTIGDTDEVSRVSARIRDLLIAAAQQRSTADGALTTFIELAVEGRSLHGELTGRLRRIGDPKRIQIVSTRPSWFLPLEFVYDREAPDDDASLCDRWAGGDECGPGCFADEHDRSVVCPSVFWGMSRVIEREYVDAGDEAGTAFLVGPAPERERTRIIARRSVLAASVKVAKEDVSATAALLGVEALTSWEAWEQAIAAEDTDLLILMPHTDAKQDTLEISRKKLRGGRIEARYVTGRRKVTPVVVLFGCDTSGSGDNPAGYAAKFKRADAGVVFATLTMVLGSHAAAMSQRLATYLLDQSRSAVPMGEALTQFRRESVRAGLLAALSVTAYGDTDWRV